MTYSSTVLTFAAVVVLSSPARAQQPTPAAILARVDSVYANAKSYSDSGSVDVTSFMASATRLSTKPFTTYFVRPDRFRFEYSETFPGGNRVMNYILWRGEGLVQTWADMFPSKIRTDTSFNRAIGGATGVSGRAAATIPALLMPQEITAYRITTRIVDIKRIDDSVCSARECIRLKGIFLRDSVAGRPTGDTTTVWIDKESYLIRRIDLIVRQTQVSFDQSTTYYPAINGAIADSLLKLRPPDR